MKTQLMVGAAAAALLLSFGFASAQGTATAPLAAPAKSEPPKVPVGNHYVCYPVKSQEFTERDASFSDQFFGRSVKVVAITRLCTPAAKKVGTRETKIVNGDLHLVCYAIKPNPKTKVPPPPPAVLTNDQFGLRTLNMAEPTEVCLPAGKTIIR